LARQPEKRVVIAAHQTMLAPQGGPSSRDYVQDSAFLFFDGIENAGRGTHNASATSWANLSGSASDATPQHNCEAVWTQDSLSFNEVGNWRSSLSSVTWPSGYMTCEIVLRQNVYGTWAGRVVQTNDTSSQRFDVVMPLSTSAWAKQIIMGSAASNVTISKVAPPMAQTFAVAFSTASNSCTFRWDGQSQSVTVYGRPSSKPPYLTIGGNNNNDRNFKGEVCAVRFHSRKLTNDEIDANAALDRTRFGVT